MAGGQGYATPLNCPVSRPGGRTGQRLLDADGSQAGADLAHNAQQVKGQHIQACGSGSRSGKHAQKQQIRQ